MKIEVCKRFMDRTWDGKPKYHVQIKERPGVWGCGDSIDDAIGNLIRSHQKTFDIQIKYLGTLPR